MGLSRKDKIEYEWFKERVEDMGPDQMAHFLQLYDCFSSADKTFRKYVNYLMKELKSQGFTHKDIPYMEYCD